MLHAVPSQRAGDEIHRHAVAILEAMRDFRQIRESDDGQTAVDRVALIDGAEALRDDRCNPQRAEAIHRLLPRRARPEIAASHDDVTRLRAAREVLPALEVIEGVLPHLPHISDVQIAIVENHIGVYILI